MRQELTDLKEQAIEGLTALGDPVRAENECRYFKGTIRCLGTGLPALQKLEREMFGDSAESWSVADAMKFADALIQEHLFEVTLFALTFLSRFSSRLTEAELSRFEEWVQADLLDNWAAVDHLGPHVVGPMLEREPALAERVAGYATSGNRWMRRLSAVSFVLLVRKGMFLDLAYSIAEKLLTDKTDDLVQKGNGWLLRDCGTTDMPRLERFLLDHGPDIPRTSVRYAIEHFPANARKRLLAETKGR